ncbi:hypothetical protein HYV64_02190 [Candidatus Shapirobacteria bacterium]|nr:hypothetical protein [Candidatus Shapirobacteria bacterium]
MTKLVKLLFFPHEDNNHKAFLIQPGYIGLLIGVYLLNQSFIRTLTIARPGVLGYSSEITAQKVIDQTNARRAQAGLAPLLLNPVLSQSAAAKADNMFAENYWSHNSPSGKTPWDFFKAVKYQYSVAGENLAKDFYDTDSMMRAWMNSPTHKANIVNTKYQEIGIGVVNGVLRGVKTTLVVQHFGTPLSSQVRAADTSNNQTDEIAIATNEPPVTETVLAEVSAPAVTPSFMISPLQISQLVGLAMFIVIIVTLIIDIISSMKTKNHRLSSSSLSHVGFLAIILMLLLFTRQGNILY